MFERIMQSFTRWFQPKFQRLTNHLQYFLANNFSSKFPSATVSNSATLAQSASSAIEKKATPDKKPTSDSPIVPTTSTSAVSSSPHAPQSLEELIDIISHTPLRILGKTDRARLAAVMSFNEKQVQDLMAPKDKIIFVKSTEILGPLMLDKLYKSGFTNFPVIDSKEKIKGVIHTEALNSLEIKRAERADKYLDRHVSYLHASDSLAHAVAEIERTNSYYFLVNDTHGNLIGFFTTKMLLDYLLGKS